MGSSGGMVQGPVDVHPASHAISLAASEDRRGASY
ncbi:hypothetical protein HaLaN_17791, partial [Haematococcus lacustris]